MIEIQTILVTIECYIQKLSGRCVKNPLHRARCEVSERAGGARPSVVQRKCRSK